MPTTTTPSPRATSLTYAVDWALLQAENAPLLQLSCDGHCVLAL